MRLRPFLRRLRGDFASIAPAMTIVATVITVACGFVALAIFVVVPTITGHPYFTLRSVKVACDTNTVEPQSLAVKAGLFEGVSLWNIDPRKAERALELEPWVRDASITRRFPDHVIVEVERRDPVAATVLDGIGAYLVDEHGVLYRQEGVSAPYDLPYVSGWDQSPSQRSRVLRMRSSLALLDSVEERGIEVSEVHVDIHGVYWIYPSATRAAVKVGLPRKGTVGIDAEQADDVAVRIARVLGSMSDDVRNAGMVAMIDLSIDDRAVVKAKTGHRDHLIRLLAEPGKDDGATQRIDTRPIDRKGSGHG